MIISHDQGHVGDYLEETDGNQTYDQMLMNGNRMLLSVEVNQYENRTCGGGDG